MQPLSLPDNFVSVTTSTVRIHHSLLFLITLLTCEHLPASMSRMLGQLALFVVRGPCSRWPSKPSLTLLKLFSFLPKTTSVHRVALILLSHSRVLEAFPPYCCCDSSPYPRSNVHMARNECGVCLTLKTVAGRGWPTPFSDIIGDFGVDRPHTVNL